jgi:hypothetical protein
MKKINFLFVLLILSACTPQVTEIPTVTSPPPTQTPLPTPTLHPEFVELQNLIADSSENLNLLPDGQIEENGVVIPNLQVDQNGEISILVEGQNIVIDSAHIIFEDGFHINGYELNENGEWVEAEEPIKEFPICSSVEYRDCKLESVDDLAEYYRFFETLAQPFEAGQLDQRPWYLDGFNIIMPDLWVPREPGTVTAHLNITFAMLEVDGIQYKIIPFELPDPSDPTNPEANIRVLGFQVMNQVKNGVIGDIYSQSILNRASTYWAEKVIVPPIVADYHYPLSGVEIPLAKRTWEALGEDKMTEIFDRLQTGDTTALRELQGYPIMLDDAYSDGYEQ